MLYARPSAGRPFHFLKRGTSNAGIAGNLIMQNPNRTLLINNDICLKVNKVIINSIDIYHKTD
jgi:hypothetical protein